MSARKRRIPADEDPEFRPFGGGFRARTPIARTPEPLPDSFDAEEDDDEVVVPPGKNVPERKPGKPDPFPDPEPGPDPGGEEDFGKRRPPRRIRVGGILNSVGDLLQGTRDWQDDRKLTSRQTMFKAHGK